MIKRGEIYYIENDRKRGRMTKGNRPAVVVSNDKANCFSDCVEVVYLTTAKKKPLPTHVQIFSAQRRSTALCEEVDTVAVEQLGRYCGRLSARELLQMDEALLNSLGIGGRCGWKE